MRPLDPIVQCERFASVGLNTVYAMSNGSGPLARSDFALGLHLTEALYVIRGCPRMFEVGNEATGGSIRPYGTYTVVFLRVI